MPKEKFHIEFLMGNATQSSLWRMVSQIDGLSEWFADEVSMDETETFTPFTGEKQAIRRSSSIKNHCQASVINGPMRRKILVILSSYCANWIYPAT